LRFREQLKRLEADGWWKTVKDLPSEHISLLKSLAEQDEYVFLFSEKQMPSVFTEAFETIIESIHELVVGVTAHCGTLAEDFGRRRADIEKCLLHGVVPSQLLVEGEPLSPLPVSMINAGYCFYLTRLPELMDRFEDRKASVFKDRQASIERLEAWTMKGIEDYQLLDAIGRESP
jgi:hypothetical protein